MDAVAPKPWMRVAVLLGVVYFVFGIAFAAFAGWSGTHSLRVSWNRLGFLASAVAFAAHIAYEHFRLVSSPRVTALHTAVAVALGAFLLAVSATVHAVTVPSHAPYWQFLLALVAWPTITALPAFLVALGAAAALAYVSRRRFS